MAEQKEKTNLTIKRKDLFFDGHGFKIPNPEDLQWHCYAKLDKLGSKGKQRLKLFMESLGFACEDMLVEGKRRFFPNEDGKMRPNELSYTLAVGACLCLGYDCVKKGREIIVFLDGLE